jgi:hypothetical protein
MGNGGNKDLAKNQAAFGEEQWSNYFSNNNKQPTNMMDTKS